MTKLDIIANALPLTVRGIEVTDPILTLSRRSMVTEPHV